jgi:hypothetical protein
LVYLAPGPLDFPKTTFRFLTGFLAGTLFPGPAFGAGATGGSLKKRKKILISLVLVLLLVLVFSLVLV